MCLTTCWRIKNQYVHPRVSSSYINRKDVVSHTSRRPLMIIVPRIYHSEWESIRPPRCRAFAIQPVMRIATHPRLALTSLWASSISHRSAPWHACTRATVCQGANSNCQTCGYFGYLPIIMGKFARAVDPPPEDAGPKNRRLERTTSRPVSLVIIHPLWTWTWFRVVQTHRKGPFQWYDLWYKINNFTLAGRIRIHTRVADHWRRLMSPATSSSV